MTSSHGYISGKKWYAICALAALVGPLLSFVSTRAYVSFAYVLDSQRNVIETNVVTEAFISVFMDTASLLWPPQLLGTLEYTWGWFRTEVLLDALNILLYLLLGWMIVCAAHAKWLLITLGIVIGSYLFLFSFWGAGYDFKYVNWASILLSAAFFGTLMFLGTRVKRSSPRSAGS